MARKRKPNQTAVKRVIKTLGGPTNAGRLLGVSTWSACLYRDGKRCFPAHLAPRAERLTRERGNTVTCEEIWPDVEWVVLRNTSRNTANGSGS